MKSPEGESSGPFELRQESNCNSPRTPTCTERPAQPFSHSEVVHCGAGFKAHGAGLFCVFLLSQVRVSLAVRVPHTEHVLGGKASSDLQAQRITRGEGGRRSSNRIGRAWLASPAGPGEARWLRANSWAHSGLDLKCSLKAPGCGVQRRGL